MYSYKPKEQSERLIHKAISDICLSMSAKVLQYRERLNNEIDNLVDTKEDIKKVISKVENPKARLILTQKYINFHTFEYIAIKMNMEKRQVYRLHKKAIEDLCNFL